MYTTHGLTSGDTNANMIISNIEFNCLVTAEFVRFSIVMFRVFPVSCGPWKPAKGAPMSSWSHRDFKQVLAVIILNSMYSSGPTVES